MRSCSLAHRVFGKASTVCMRWRCYCWFIDPATRMNPHLKYADVMLGHHLDQGWAPVSSRPRPWYLLEAVRLLAAEAASGGLA